MTCAGIGGSACKSIAALIIIYWGGVRIEQLGPLFGFADTSLGRLSVPFTVFATVGLVNAMNMIDGADGLAGSLGLAALLMLAAASVYAGNLLLASRVLILAGRLPVSWSGTCACHGGRAPMRSWAMPAVPSWAW